MDIKKTTDSIISQMGLWESFHKDEIKRIVRRCTKYNKKIETAIKRFDTNELYLDKSGIISPPVVAELITLEVVNKELIITLQGDKYRVSLELDYEDECYYIVGTFDFDQDISYCNKCITNGIRFWESENPDGFLESEDIEE